MPKAAKPSRPAIKPRPATVAAANGKPARGSKPIEILRLPIWAYVLGLVGILAALVGSGGLAVSHVTGHPLPGCGGGAINSGAGMALTEQKHESACATLDAHPMGSLGGMVTSLKTLVHDASLRPIAPLEAKWPVSFLGASYFAAALVGWIVIGKRGRKLPAIIPWIVRVGALTSILYAVVIVLSTITTGKDPCPYCITSHIGNLTLWIALEIGMMKARSLSLGGWKMDRSWSAVIAGIAVFAMSSGVLAVKESSRIEEILIRDKAEQEKTAKELEKRIAEQKAQAEQAAAEPKKEATPWGPPKGFRGRWLLGPTETPVRVVMLTDFQCPDCHEFEGKLMQAYEKYPGQISISIVHYPMCQDCNPKVGISMHANACRAARAAEAAAIIARNRASIEGKDEAAAANEMFWKMANWLFSVKGQFEDEQLAQVMPTMGITGMTDFMAVMNGPKTLQLVQDDCKWGEVLGLFYTPMMFVNGVEVRGWQANRMALNQTIDAAIAAKPASMDARNDHPPLIDDKKFLDWKESPRRTIMPGNPAYVKSGPGAKVEVVIFGDLCEPGTKTADALVQGFLAKNKAIKYSFRHYPVCAECNPGVANKYPNACIAAQAVEAAGVVGGPDAYFKMRDFIFGRGGNVTQTLLSMNAEVQGLDQAKFDAALISGPVKTAVQNDVMAGKGVIAQFIPAVFVDGKYVERWQSDTSPVLERIIDYAIQHPGE